MADGSGPNGKNDEVPTRKEQSPSDRKSQLPALFSSVFFGMPPRKGEKEQAPAKTSQGKARSSGAATGPDVHREAQSPAAFRIDDYIPHDPKELRETQLFKSTYKLIQWQRDNYLVGEEYANWRREERAKDADVIVASSTPQQVPQNNLPFDETALGHQQMAHLASWFVPSETVRKALLPIVVGLPSGDALYRPTRNATVDLILSQQANLDHILKNHLDSYLQNEQNRKAIKNSTQGFISKSYQDDNKDEEEADFDDQEIGDIVR